MSFISILGQAVRQIVMVMVVGMGMATVFTVWTPDSGTGPSLAEQLAGVLNVRQPESNITAVPVTVTQPPATPTAGIESLRIGLVAGHNGPQNDPGAVCPDGLTEAGINHDIATRIKAGLEANGFQVDLLDEFDPRLENYRALALVSIHNDSCEYINELATGYKVAGALENQARAQSTQLTACLTDRYAKATSLRFHAGSVTRDMTQYHSFSEIASETPAAIIETGFLNLDRPILTQEPFRVAQGVIDGIICYVRGEPVGSREPVNTQ
ncbi:MAG: N-acetylmuramoyl-L-alanine amidase family protein [Anaerolineales bacterium]